MQKETVIEMVPRPEGHSADSGDSGNSGTSALGVPGFDLIDGIANVLFCPGRAIMLQTAPQGLSSKDLPVVILLSAAAWYGIYWLATSESSPIRFVGKPKVAKRVFRVPRKGKVIETVEDDEEEIEGDED